MTVQSEIDFIGYDGPGSVFAIPFRFLADADIRITKALADGTSQTLVLTTDYTLVGARQQSGGTATLVVALVADERIVIDRGNMQRTQLVDYRANDPFPEESAEDIADRLTMLLQQGLLDGSARSLRLSPVDIDGSGTYQGNGNRIADISDAVDPTDVPNLAQVTGLIGPGSGPFIQSGTGAVIRTYQDKARERVSVLDFIPVAEHAAIKAGTTTYDATADIQEAIASLTNGGALYFPEGVYLITSELTVTTNGITLVGAARRTSVIRQDTLNARCLNVTGQYTCVTQLGFSYGSGTPTSGATAIRSAALYCHYRDVLILRSYTGIEFTGSGGQKLRDFEIFDYEFAGVHCISVNDVFIAGSILNAGNTSRGQGGGIRLEEKTEAIIVQDIDVLSGRYSMVTTSAAFTAGNRPAYNNFSNCFFDSSAEGVIIGNMVETEFVGCWSSGGRTGGGFPGWTIGQSVALQFTNCRAFNNGSHGYQVNSTAARVRFVNCSAHSNSFTAGNGVAHGFNFNGASGFALIGCTSSNGLAAGSQGYGVALDSSCANFSIRDCLLSGNQTGAISDATVDDGTVTKHIGGNIGYVTQKKGTGTVAIGQTVATVTHGLAAQPSEADIVISPTTLMSAAGITSWRILNFTSTQFQLQVNAAVAGSAFNFGWSARIKGA